MNSHTISGTRLWWGETAVKGYARLHQWICLAERTRGSLIFRILSWHTNICHCCHGSVYTNACILSHSALSSFQLGWQNGLSLTQIQHGIRDISAYAAQWTISWGQRINTFKGCCHGDYRAAVVGRFIYCLDNARVMPGCKYNTAPSIISI